jgi:RNA polymerase sigma factor (sigma-70 family)
VDEVQPHELKLRSWLRARFPSLEDTDDVVQESYVRLLRAREARPIRNTKSYLFSTALHVALDLFRRDRSGPFQPVSDVERLSILEERPAAGDCASRAEELQILREAVEALPTRCRQIFTLRKLYGLSHREIAAKLGISEKTIEEQVNRGIRRCSAFLRRRGIP